MAEQLSELCLPLTAVLHQGGLEWGTVQRDKPDVQYGLFLLNTVGLFCVPGGEPENGHDTEKQKREINVSARFTMAVVTRLQFACKVGSFLLLSKQQLD